MPHYTARHKLDIKFTASLIVATVVRCLFQAAGSTDIAQPGPASDARPPIDVPYVLVMVEIGLPCSVLLVPGWPQIKGTPELRQTAHTEKTNAAMALFKYIYTPFIQFALEESIWRCHRIHRVRILRWLCFFLFFACAKFIHSDNFSFRASNGVCLIMHKYTGMCWRVTCLPLFFFWSQPRSLRVLVAHVMVKCHEFGHD